MVNGKVPDSRALDPPIRPAAGALLGPMDRRVAANAVRFRAVAIEPNTGAGGCPVTMRCVATLTGA